MLDHQTNKTIKTFEKLNSASKSQCDKKTYAHTPNMLSGANANDGQIPQR